MTRIPYPRLAMLGAAPGTRGGMDGVVAAYRAHGLFKRWPIDYLVTHGDEGAARNAARVLGALRDFLLLLARERRVVVHLHASPGTGFWRDAPFMALAIAAGCPLILHLHGAGFGRFHDGAGRYARAAIRFLFEHAASIVVPCEFQRTWARSVAPRARVVCLPAPLAPAEAPPEVRRPNLVLFLGRLEPATGLFDLIEAVAALRPEVPDVRLVCAGEGDRIAAARLAKRLGLGDAVTFTGWVGPSGKRALLETAAVFALPSYEEAVPMSLLEAMNAGVPVVASQVGGVPEVVVDGISGFLVAPGDVATLQRLLRKVLLDRDLGARIGVAGRQSVRLRCAPERALAKLEELYAALGLQAFGTTPWPASQAG